MMIILAAISRPFLGVTAVLGVDIHRSDHSSYVPYLDFEPLE